MWPMSVGCGLWVCDVAYGGFGCDVTVTCIIISHGPMEGFEYCIIISHGPQTLHSQGRMCPSR